MICHCHVGDLLSSLFLFQMGKLNNNKKCPAGPLSQWVKLSQSAESPILWAQHKCPNLSNKSRYVFYTLAEKRRSWTTIGGGGGRRYSIIEEPVFFLLRKDIEGTRKEVGHSFFFPFPSRPSFSSPSTRHTHFFNNEAIQLKRVSLKKHTRVHIVVIFSTPTASRSKSILHEWQYLDLCWLHSRKASHPSRAHFALVKNSFAPTMITPSGRA
jgi:hypothetical protein